MTEAFTIFNVVRILAVAAVSFFIALAIEPLWMRILKKYFSRGKEIAKEGTPVFNALHKKKEGTPTMGGFIIWFSVVLVTVVFWVLHGTIDGFWSRVNFLVRGETWLPFAFLIVAGLIGIADDITGIRRRGGLGMKQRLLLYTALAAVGGWWFVTKLGKAAINIPFLGDHHIGAVWYFLLFVFVMVATAFSMNETDGLDGLSGGTSLIILAAYTAIAFDQGRMDLAVFLAALMGALVAFLWFNIYPARFFMGDTGIMAIGFTVGVVAMLTNTPLLLPVIAIIPLGESLSVIIQMTSKKLRGKKISISTPIHHTFEALGWPETQITMRFWMINASGALLGLTLFLADSKLPPLTGQVIQNLFHTVIK